MGDGEGRAIGDASGVNPISYFHVSGLGEAASMMCVQDNVKSVWLVTEGIWDGVGVGRRRR